MVKTLNDVVCRSRGNVGTGVCREQCALHDPTVSSQPCTVVGARASLFSHTFFPAHSFLSICFCVKHTIFGIQLINILFQYKIDLIPILTITGTLG